MIVLFPLLMLLILMLASRLRHAHDRADAPRGCCPRCGYSLAGLGAPSMCPECGLAAAEHSRWHERQTRNRAHARLASVACALAGVAAVTAAVVLWSGAGADGLVFLMMFVTPAFVLTAVLPPYFWRRPWAAFVVSAWGSVLAAASEIAAAWLAFVQGPPDAQAGLVIVAFPVLGGTAAALGLLVGAGIVYAHACTTAPGSRPPVRRARR